MPKRKLKGTIISNKCEKTVTVKVQRVREHPKYKKRIRMDKKYKAHTDQPYEIGDKVVIQETKPISKDKKFIVIEKI